MPESWPQMSSDEIEALAGLSYEEVAFRVIKPFIGDTFNDDELREILSKAYASFKHDARCPLVQLGSNDFLLELHQLPAQQGR